MLKNPQDRCAVRTASQIKETMYSFLETTAIHQVSVLVICRTCQINRAAFYDHYRDVFDFAASGYYRFFVLSLTEPWITISAEAALCARLSDACLETLFTRRQTKNGVFSP